VPGVAPMIFLASLSIASAPKALLLRPVLAAAFSTIRFSACERYTTNLNGFSDLGRRRGMDRGAFIQKMIGFHTTAQDSRKQQLDFSHARS
jgi:hypothetical protein